MYNCGAVNLTDEERQARNRRVREFRKKNPERVRATWRKYRENNAEIVRNSQIKSKYGKTVAEIELIIREQNNSCAACKDVFDKKNVPCIDHDHNTNEVRGILCQRCNKALGLLKDNSKRIKGLLEYIMNFETNKKEVSRVCNL